MPRWCRDGAIIENFIRNSTFHFINYKTITIVNHGNRTLEPHSMAVPSVVGTSPLCWSRHRKKFWRKADNKKKVLGKL